LSSSVVRELSLVARSVYTPRAAASTRARAPIYYDQMTGRTAR